MKGVPGWQFSSISNDRGREPFGKVEIPSAGSYRIRVTPATTHSLWRSAR